MTLHDDIAKLQTVQAGHEIRFDNGRHEMADLKQQIVETGIRSKELVTALRIEMRDELVLLKPKAPDWLKLLMSGIAVIGVLSGAQLWVSAMLADRPRWDQMGQALSPIKDVQDKMREVVKSIELSQREQAASIRAIEAGQASASDKLDRVLASPGRR